MNRWLNIIESAALSAYESIKDLIGTREGATPLSKGASGDMTLKVDALAENAIIKKLEETGYPIKLITEERGIVDINNDLEGEQDIHVIVDPVDGSKNASRGIPISAVSIAIADGSRMKDVFGSVVIDLHCGDVYKALKGNGAWLNDKLLIMNDHVEDLTDAIVSINLNPRGYIKSRVKLIDTIKKFLEFPSKIRVLGCTAISTVLVARGAIDAFIDFNTSTRLLDIAGSWLILKEVNGITGELLKDKLNLLDEMSLTNPSKINFVAIANENLYNDIIEKFKISKD
ncbi:MAG: inositol monophosphatase family protein [Promethearchaeota archaeon]